MVHFNRQGDGNPFKQLINLIKSLIVNINYFFIDCSSRVTLITFSILYNFCNSFDSSSLLKYLFNPVIKFFLFKGSFLLLSECAIYLFLT